MTKEEIEKRLKELDQREFLIQMHDHLSNSDYDKLHAINQEQLKLKEELKNV